MKRAHLPLLLVIFLVFSWMPQSVAQENERPAACTQYDKIAIPPADLPTPHDRQTLASCNSEDLYFAFGQPADPVQARKCAYMERESGDAPIFGGSGLLTMIYANAKGAARNLDLALKFACEVNDPLQNTNGRVERLLEMREEHWTGDNFSLCDVGGPSFWVGVCSQLAEQFAQIERDRKVDRIAEKWAPAVRAAFVHLQERASDFFELSSRHEVDLTGTGRASFVVEWKAWLRDGFLDALERAEQGHLPSFSAADFKKADEELNAAYSGTRTAKPDSNTMGTVTAEDIRMAQDAWVRYREAWVKFGLVRYPRVKPESWRTWLTYDRIVMFNWIPGPQTPDWKAFQEYLPWRYQYELGNYREAIRLKPDWAPPHNGLGGDLSTKGDWDGAMKEYREAIRLDPNYFDAHEHLAFAFEKRKDWDGAVKEYREVVRLEPKDAIWRGALGRALAQNKDWDGAIQEYREAIRLEPNALHISSLADALAGKKDWDGAIGEYRKAIGLEPDNPRYHNSLADALASKKDWDGVIQEYRETVRLTPKNGDAHDNLGWALINKKDWDGAIKEFREAIRLVPGDAYAHSHLGVALENTKDLDGAIKEYREAVRLKPDDAGAHYSLAGAFEGKKDWNGAATEFAEAARLNPQDRWAQGRLGWALEKKGDRDGAIKAYREAIRLKPDWAEARSNLGYQFYEKGDLDAAIAECREAIRLKPDYAPAHLNLGVALDKKGDWDGAIREYREAFRLEPDPGELHYYVGQALEHKGDKQAALDEYRQASEADPKNSDYRAAYDKLRKELK